MSFSDTIAKASAVASVFAQVFNLPPKFFFSLYSFPLLAVIAISSGIASIWINKTLAPYEERFKKWIFEIYVRLKGLIHDN